MKSNLDDEIFKKIFELDKVINAISFNGIRKYRYERLENFVKDNPFPNLNEFFVSITPLSSSYSTRKGDEYIEREDNDKIAMIDRKKFEIIKLIEAKKAEHEKENLFQREKIQAEERQRQRDFELRKMELELQLQETKLLREREEREAIHGSIQGLRDAMKD